MFEISLKKVIIGTAVIGGVAVAGYYSYKWYTKRESNPKEDGKFNDESVQSVKKAELESQVEPTETNAAKSRSNMVAMDDHGNAVQKGVQKEVQVTEVEVKAGAKDGQLESREIVAEVVQDGGKTTDAKSHENSGMTVESQAVDSTDGQPESDAEMKCGEIVAEVVQDGGKTTDATPDVNLPDGQPESDAEMKCGEIVAEVVQDGGKTTDAKSHKNSGMTVESQAVDSPVHSEHELGACGGTATEEKTDGMVAGDKETAESVGRIAGLMGGEWGSRIRNEIYVPPILQNVRTKRDLDQTMEALSAFLFKLPRTEEELREVQLELGWVFDFALSYLHRVPEKVPVLRVDTETVTYAYDGTPMEKVD